MSKIITPYRIGELVAGEGIYLGEWQPRDRDGKSLKKTFNLFASSKTLGIGAGYYRTLEKIALLKNYYGHNGIAFANDERLILSLKNEKYNGQWFLPTADILHDVIYSEHKKSAANSKFKVILHKSWYWTCNENLGSDKEHSHAVSLFSGAVTLFNKASNFYAYPVRATEITPQEIAAKFKTAIALQKPLKLKPPLRFKS